MSHPILYEQVGREREGDRKSSLCCHPILYKEEGATLPHNCGKGKTIFTSL